MTNTERIILVATVPVAITLPRDPALSSDREPPNQPTVVPASDFQELLSCKVTIWNINVIFWVHKQSHIMHNSPFVQRWAKKQAQHSDRSAQPRGGTMWRKVTSDKQVNSPTHSASYDIVLRWKCMCSGSGVVFLILWSKFMAHHPSLRFAATDPVWMKLSLSQY